MEESGTRCQLAAPSGSIYSFSEASAGATREVSMETFNSWNLRELGASTVSMRQFFCFYRWGWQGGNEFCRRLRRAPRFIATDSCLVALMIDGVIVWWRCGDDFDGDLMIND